jgi:2-iminobutanoate/2-iminopropanoate deaminase
MTDSIREIVPSTGLPAAVGPFSTGIIARGRTVFLSGQGPQDPATSRFVLGTVEEQARLALDNLGRALDNAGAGWSDVVRVGIYLADLDDFAAVNAVYRTYVIEPFPARTTIGATLLAGMKVEVDCIAVV